MPPGTKIISAEPSGVSAWTKTAKISVTLPDGKTKKYFLELAFGIGDKPLTEGEFYSASLIYASVPGLVPQSTGYGSYSTPKGMMYFYLCDFHNMDLRTAPEPRSFASQLAKLHREAVSPTGLFVFPVPTACGIIERTVTWEKCWATLFKYQLEDVINFDNKVNAPWPEYDAACKQIIDEVIPRLLLPLQSEGRSIEPVLVHGDLWEGNLGIDMESGETIMFDPGSTYAHNEMEFGTWRCTWAYYLNSSSYMRAYQQHIEPSEPVDQWDDRNRLYGIRAYLNDSAGHPGSPSRQIAYNDMLYLCEQYAPLDSLEKYSPEKDISVTGAYVPYVTKQLE
ncbi:hypothetical protein B0A52_01582 [Exophiala mesophila]|uniref:protein-ribulosamine 3-kinase n=1 Tax=Exophiala mesophila TaxID=212818 RepID=A0A438NFE5_EXOME|nr:hypothetical protein B0A52_01582 [Exophiala mesophila]